MINPYKKGFSNKKWMNETMAYLSLVFLIPMQQDVGVYACYIKNHVVFPFIMDAYNLERAQQIGP